MDLDATRLSSLPNTRTDSTKRYIDDIFTVSLGHTIGPSLQDIISQNGVFYGMYPTTIREFDGGVRPSPISIVREQVPVEPSIHFLDMEIIQPFPGVCGVKMYDKRDDMPKPWLRTEGSPISRQSSLLGVSMLSYIVSYAGSHIGVHKESISSKLRLD